MAGRANGWLNSVPAKIAAHKKKLIAIGVFCAIAIVLLAIGVDKERIGIMGIGFLGNAIMAYAFNWGLCPLIIKRFRLVKGFFLMILASFLVNYATILFYDWAKQDWLGIELVKEVKEYQGDTRTGTITSWVLKQGDPVIFVFLSIKFDPFITTVYMREGANRFNGMNGKDWMVFLLSTIVGDIYWALTLFWGISLIERLWPAWKKLCKMKC